MPIFFATSVSCYCRNRPAKEGLSVIPNECISVRFFAGGITASNAGFTTSAQCPPSICVCAHTFASCCVGGQEGHAPFAPRNFENADWTMLITIAGPGNAQFPNDAP